MAFRAVILRELGKGYPSLHPALGKLQIEQQSLADSLDTDLSAPTNHTFLNLQLDDFIGAKPGSLKFSVLLVHCLEMAICSNEYFFMLIIKVRALRNLLQVLQRILPLGEQPPAGTSIVQSLSATDLRLAFFADRCCSSFQDDELS